MTGISWMLQVAIKCPLVEYGYDLGNDLSCIPIYNFFQQLTISLEYFTRIQNSLITYNSLRTHASYDVNIFLNIYSDNSNLSKTPRDECINSEISLNILKDSNNNQHLKLLQRLDFEIPMRNVLN